MNTNEVKDWARRLGRVGPTVSNFYNDQAYNILFAVPNQSKNGIYNLISDWFNEISKKNLMSVNTVFNFYNDQA